MPAGTICNFLDFTISSTIEFEKNTSLVKDFFVKGNFLYSEAINGRFIKLDVSTFSKLLLIPSAARADEILLGSGVTLTV